MVGKTSAGAAPPLSRRAHRCWYVHSCPYDLTYEATSRFFPTGREQEQEDTVGRLECLDDREFPRTYCRSFARQTRRERRPRVFPRVSDILGIAVFRKRELSAYYSRLLARLSADNIDILRECVACIGITATSFSALRVNLKLCKQPHRTTVCNKCKPIRYFSRTLRGGTRVGARARARAQSENGSE
jgi:hypothetical protein